MFRLSVAVCPSSPIRSAFGRDTGGASQNLPVVFSFTVHRKRNYLGEVFPVLLLAGSWFKLNPSVLFFPLGCYDISSNLPRLLPPLCSAVGLLGDSLCPIPAGKTGQNNPGTASEQLLSGVKGECTATLERRWLVEQGSSWKALQFGKERQCWVPWLFY